MSSVDPAKCGKCWSCKYCDDIGTYRYEDYVSYMRKCSKPGHDLVDDCQRYCSDYVWDGKTPENSSASSSYSSGSSSSSSSSDSGSGCGKVIAIIVGLVILGSILVNTFGGLIAGKKSSSGSEPVTSSTENQLGANTQDDQRVHGIVTNNLNLRSGPSKDDDVITVIPNGAPVIILDENEDGTWAFVDYNGTTGWCSTKYLQKT